MVRLVAFDFPFGLVNRHVQFGHEGFGPVRLVRMPLHNPGGVASPSP